VKVDTGMHRVGLHPVALDGLLASVRSRPELRLAAVWTHLAVADEPDNDFTAEQLRRYGALDLPADVERHAANSAGAICHPASRFDVVRCGIALYGYAPAPGLDGVPDLRPALSLRARVSYVKSVEAGEAISYGQRYCLDRPSTIATVPIGYADGVPRRLSATGAEVVLGGRRRPIAGTITMDQLMVDCGDDDVRVGDEVVLIGEGITADDWASRLETISYEILCNIGPRVPRVYV
jgi:alanine racemase